MTRRWGIYPIYAPEMIQARLEQLHRDARVTSRHAWIPRVAKSPASRWRLASRLRIVSAGFRLLGRAVEGR